MNTKIVVSWRRHVKALLITGLLSLSGCTFVISSAGQNLADSLSEAVMASDDPDTVAAGLPAYLLLIDAFIKRDPENSQLLLAAANLNSAYAGNFAVEPAQQLSLADKAFDYARQAACQEDKRFCDIRAQQFESFTQLIADCSAKQIELLYALGGSWTGWIQQHSSDWDAVADISRVQLIMERVVALDPGYENGNGYIYLGGLSTLLPPSMGGKPDQGAAYFERAIEVSNNTNLMAKVVYAERYARLLFDRELHDRLLNEVITTDVEYPKTQLTNTLARVKAKQLLASADDYF